MPIKIIVCDIEGTTSSISFVKDNLFPYAVKNVQEYLNEKWTEAEVQETTKELREQYINDLANKVEGAVAISDGEGKDQAEQIDEIVANVKWQISNDRKTTSLKKLQGLIWGKGYGDGTLKGHVYPDVPKAFERWTVDNIKIFIYSSGSVDAQKLLFGNSEAGDLTSKISGYFDTKIGSKQEKESYAKIVQEVGCDASEILFLTDIVNEAVAAKEIGIQVAILDRPGNGPLTDEDKAKYQVLTSFDDINLEFVSGKRKLDEILTDETNLAKIAKLDTDEAVVSTITDSDVVAETNGITPPTDIIISNDTNAEKLVSNGNETDVTMNIEKKTERNDIPECDLSNKIVNLDVDVGDAEDKNNGEKNQIDSKPLIEDEVMKEIDDTATTVVVDEKSTETKLIEDDVEMTDAPTDIKVNDIPKDVEDESSKVIEVSVKTDQLKEENDVITDAPVSKSEEDISDVPTSQSEESKSEEIKSDERKSEEIKSDEIKSEEIKSEERISEEIKSDENKSEESKSEEKKTEENKSEENKSEEIKSEEIKSEENKSEENKSEQNKSEESKSEEKKTEENKSEENKSEESKSGDVQSEQAVDKEKIEIIVDVADSKQNSDHTNVDVGNGTDEIQATKLETDVEMENNEKTHSDDQVTMIENGPKDNAVDLMINNKENIPVDVKEKENIIEIPIHIDGDIKSTQKPTANGNGIAASVRDDLDADATTNSNKEKMSRIELTVEEKNIDNGQLTHTTTHIVKEITIVKKNVCESAVETVDKLPENV